MLTSYPQAVEKNARSPVPKGLGKRPRRRETIWRNRRPSVSHRLPAIGGSAPASGPFDPSATASTVRPLGPTSMTTDAVPHHGRFAVMGERLGSASTSVRSEREQELSPALVARPCSSFRLCLSVRRPTGFFLVVHPRNAVRVLVITPRATEVGGMPSESGTGARCCVSPHR